MSRFRLASCHIEILLKRRTPPEILYQSLKLLPETIYDSYETILTDIDKDDWPLTRAILLWIFANDKLPGQKPIPVNTLCSMISQASYDTNGAKLNYTLDDIKEICGCLITIVSYNYTGFSFNSWPIDTAPCYRPVKGDFDSVRFAHYTVLEYLISDDIRKGKAAFFALSENGTIDTFLQTVLEIAVNTEVQSVVPEYWTGLEHYCARAAWLAPFVWESRIAQTERFWTASTDLWLTTQLYFQQMDDKFGISTETRPIPVPVTGNSTSFEIMLTLFPDTKNKWPIRWEIGRVKDSHDLRKTLSVTITCLLLNSCWTLAKRFITENNVRIHSDTPVSFFIRSNLSGFHKYLGSAFEALALSCIQLSKEPLREAINLMKYQAGMTRVVLTCIALHFNPCRGRQSCCEVEEDPDQCCVIQLLRDYSSRDEVMAYRLTPLQLAVHCWDYFATKTLLENGVDPNGLGSLSGESVPIHLYKVNDIWGMASPLNILRNAGYAPENIDDHLRMMEKRRTFRDKIETLLISYGSTDFVRQRSQET
jgi:hypothetical protein